MNPVLHHALIAIYDLDRSRSATIDYLVRYGIDPNRVAGFCGSPTVCPISLLPNRRFDLPDHGVDAVDGIIIEAFAEDGETPLDLVAWPTADARDIRTLCGAAPILGLWAAHNRASYIFGRPLIIHKTPLEWLQTDCDGAAIIIPKLAGRLLQDIPGPFAGGDTGHVDGLRKMVRRSGERVEFLTSGRNAA